MIVRCRKPVRGRKWPAGSLGICLAAVIAASVACSGDDGSGDSPGNTAGNGGKGGAGGKGGSTGSTTGGKGGSGGSGGSLTTGGSGGGVSMGGTGASGTAGTGDSGAGGDGDVGGVAGTDATGGAAGTDATGGAAGTDATGGVAGTDATGGVAGTDATGGVAGTDATGGAAGAGTAGQSGGGGSGGGTACNPACTGGQICVETNCVCPDSTLLCGSTCYPTATGVGDAVALIDPCSATPTVACWRANQQYSKMERSVLNWKEGPQFLFDGSLDTKWFLNKKSGWIQYEFAAPTAQVKAYGVGTANDFATRDPKEWVLLGNNTGPDQNDTNDLDPATSEWTVLDSQSTPLTDSLGQAILRSTSDRKKMYVFNLVTPAAFKFYRFIIKNNNGSTNYQQSEVQLYTTAVAPGDAVPANIISGGTISAYDPEGPQMAFDGNADTQWLAFNAPSLWIQYAFATPPLDVTGYALTAGNSTMGPSGDLAKRDPMKWQLLASDDATLPDDQWVVLDSQENQVFSARKAKNTYSVTCPTRGFKFYRLKILESGGGVCDYQPGGTGSTPCVQLAEFELLGHK